MITYRARMLTLTILAAQLWACGAPPPGGARPNATGNRLTYLDDSNPFYPHRDFPKLTTPQWVGEPDVEAVVILAIDDMREPARYETFLRPILERLKQIDGRAPVSIMCNALAATNTHLPGWLAEGLSLEVHTLAHPCPLLANRNFAAAADTYHGCVELLNRIPGNRPVAYRMPCCDSMNSPSPRFYAELFNRPSPNGQFLTLDSSVMTLITSQDPTLPREWVLDADGREKFRKYLPAETNAITRVTMKSFVTTIEDYPYPYVIGRLCWEFPGMVPSDWEAQNVHGVNHATTVADWKTALDVVVRKQGTFNFIFHPHGWIRNAQMVEFIDYAVRQYGPRVKFLNFREAQERIDRFLLAGQPLRDATGADNGVRLLDLNHDGYQDVVIGNARVRRTRVWQPQARRWAEAEFPTTVAGVQFGVLHADGRATAFTSARAGDATVAGSWHFDGTRWVEDPARLNGLGLAGGPLLTRENGRDRGVRLRDADHDGMCELLVGNESQRAVFGWSEAARTWKKLEYTLPPDTAIVDAEGRDAGLRFVDVNGDGFDDALFSDEGRFSLHQFVAVPNQRLTWAVGWNDQVVSGKRGRPASAGTEIPPFVRAGPFRNNGAWFHSGHLWVQNEDTAHLPDKVDRRSFRQLLTADDPPPLAPAAALESFRLRSGFQIELVAAEPLIEDPVAIEWGADGKLWVAEMHDYPRGLDGKGRAGGRIRFLEDEDGDGRYEKSTLFLDGVPFPTGVFPWRNGVLVSAAPEIFYAEDTNGDGQADLRKPLFAGFVEGNQQHRLNGFVYGLDNWLYGANGDSGGRVRAVGQGSGPAVNLSGHDFRFRPDEGRFEAVAGETQYGRHRDDWGNWFGNNNPAWLWHFVLPEHYLARNPHLAVKSTTRMLANYPESTRCFPASRVRQRFNDPWTANHVTSGCSPVPYRDELFGSEFAHAVFISEPVHNLIHCEVLEPDGVTFRSRRLSGETNSEFLASTDNWFRPVQQKTGPDGALYIADMYRAVIEHPEWITKPIQERLDLRAGADMGRIYRVAPQGAHRRKVPRLDRLDTAGLVAALDSPNGWQRDTAQRLLVHRGDRAAVEPLAELVRAHASPKVRVQALGTLEGLGGATPELLLAALNDAHPAVREHAVRLCEAYFVHGDKPSRAGSPAAVPAETRERLGGALARLRDDPSARVRYQLAFLLGEWAEPRAGALLAELALKDFGDPHARQAVMSSAVPHAATMLRTLLPKAEEGAPAGLIEQLLGLAAALNQDEVVLGALDEMSRPGGAIDARQFAAWAAVLEALERRRTTFEAVVGKTGAGSASRMQRFTLLLAKARERAADVTSPEATRLAAIRLLGRAASSKPEEVRELGRLLSPQNPGPVQEAALSALAKSRSSQIAEVLVAAWAGSTPGLRHQLAGVLVSRPEWLRAMLQAVEEGRIVAAQVGAAHQQQFLAHAEAPIRERAAKVFSAIRADRQALLHEYRAVNQLKGDPAAGAELFRKNCALCHRFRGEGVELGPDLGTLAGKPIDNVLLSILDPNQAVETRYLNYHLATRGGRELSGVIVAETSTSLTVRATGGHEEVILRSDVESLTSSGLSIMPEGLEQGLPPPAMADLLAYLLGP